MKTQAIAMLSLLAALTGAAHADDNDGLIDCFYQANQLHPACSIDVKSASEPESTPHQLASVGRVRNPEELVDCFYEYNRYNAACQ